MLRVNQIHTATKRSRHVNVMVIISNQNTAQLDENAAAAKTNHSPNDCACVWEQVTHCGNNFN